MVRPRSIAPAVLAVLLAAVASSALSSLPVSAQVLDGDAAVAPASGAADTAWSASPADTAGTLSASPADTARTVTPVTTLPTLATPKPRRWFFGGGIGASFGDVDYFEITPFVGYRVTPQLSTGVGLLYRYRNDDRYGREISTSDYGFNVFGRYKIHAPLFVQGEYELLSYQFLTTNGFEERENFSSFFGGGGISQPLGRSPESPAFFMLVLYNFSHDADDFPQPYDTPWSVRVGVSVGF